jgi:Protein of unknown function (DUF2939)
MKRLVGLILTGLAVFYIAWPAFAAYQIKSSLDAQDAASLSSRVDFDSVRQSLRPAISATVESSINAAAEKAGPAGAGIYGALKGQLMPKLVDSALAQFVTPQTLIKLHSEGLTLKQAMDKLVIDQVAKQGGAGGAAGGLGGGQIGGSVGKILGGLFGKTDPTSAPPPVTTPATGDAAAKSGAKYSLANVKGVGLDGPLAIYLMLAKDPSASKADVTARMTFSGGGWKLTALEPTL